MQSCAIGAHMQSFSKKGGLFLSGKGVLFGVHRQLREGWSVGFSEIGERLTAEVLLGCFEGRLLAVKRASESVVWWGFEIGSRRGVSAGLQKRARTCAQGEGKKRGREEVKRGPKRGKGGY